MLRFLLLWLAAFAFFGSSRGQQATDTLRLPLENAEKMFLLQNYSLLAQKYNVDAQQALIWQAKLWPNPNFAISHGLYSGTINTWFPVGPNDETTLDLSQLVLLAGKRNKQIKLAQAGVKLAQYQFYDLIRTLKYTLRTDFFNIYYLLQSSKVYKEEINSLQQVANAFAEQQGKGYVAQTEVVRIKAQLYSLKSEFNDLINQINDTESELKLILQVKPVNFIYPQIDSGAIASLQPSQITMATLLDSAYKNRTDLLIARTNNDINVLNYTYQKALATPDVTFTVGYDEQGSFLTNYVGIGASIDLPIWNRNQGNIKSAKSMIDYTTATQKSTEATVEGNVFRSLQKAIDNDKMFRSIDPQFASDFDRLQQAVLNNYQKRNISLLEFLDFYDAYKQNVLQLNQIAFNRVSAFEDLNFYTGTNFFN